MRENSEYDKKSLKLFQGKNAAWGELAKDCVCFANATGGFIHIGIENDDDEPPANQKVPDELVEKVNKTIPQRTHNVGVAATKQIAENGGEFISLQIFRSGQSIASTTDGKYYMRVSDDCQPILPEDLSRLAAEKQAFVWEEKVVRKIPLSEVDPTKKSRLLQDIRSSERVSDFIKEMSDSEIFDHYLMTSEGYLTNLGVLWIGQRKHRALLHYAPSIQFIKYDENDQKTKKLVWDEFMENPKELLSAVVNDIPEWKDSIEISDGIFRKEIPNYDVAVIRELVANALVHRVYSMRGDIFINHYPDRLEICSPGPLPLGVTPKNIISKSIHRNTHLAKVFYDLKLMEKEGSGYDKVYELLMFNGKPEPVVVENDDSVTVIIKKNVISNDITRLMSKANDDFDLKQREIITLGLIAQAGTITALELRKKLNIDDGETLNRWLGKLLKNEIIQSKGKTKGTEYFVNPELLRQVDFKGRTDLKRIEPHRLQELIIEDLKLYKESSISEINNRIGTEINQRKVKRMLDKMIDDKLVVPTGERKWRKYSIDQNMLKKR